MNLETVLIPIDKLHAYENNAKIHTPKQIEHIRNSIREFGFNDPVGIWTNPAGEYEIVTGHGAVEAARAEGMDAVPCNILDHLTDEERRAYCHVHNQTQLETSFDYDALIADMDNLNCDWENFGFEGFCFDPENYGTEFELSDNNNEVKTMTFTFDKDEFEFIESTLNMVDVAADVRNKKSAQLLKALNYGTC